MFQKQFVVIVVFFLVLLFIAETEAANLFFNPLGPDADAAASGFALTYGPTNNISTFKGQISNYPIGEAGIVGAFVFRSGKEICIGIALVDSKKNYEIQIYGDDPATDSVEGAQDGDVIIFKALINGQLNPLVPIGGATYPVWKKDQLISDVNLNIEKAGIETFIDDIMIAGTGVGATGGLPSELTNLTESDSSGGFGVPTGDDTPTIPEPTTVILFFASLPFLFKKK
jgi:hypothetical protein